MYATYIHGFVGIFGIRKFIWSIYAVCFCFNREGTLRITIQLSWAGPAGAKSNRGVAVLYIGRVLIQSSYAKPHASSLELSLEAPKDSNQQCSH